MRQRRLRLPALGLALVLFVFSALLGCKRAESNATPAPSPAASLADRAASAAPSGSPSAAPGAEAARPAGAWQRPFLWQIESKLKGKACYLFGTIHIPDPRLDVMPPGLERALGSADAVYAEIPLDPETQLTVAPKLMMPNGKSLQSILPPELYAKVEGLFNERGLPFAPFSSMKPWVVSTQLALLDKMKLLVSKKPLDMAIYTRAQSEGKKVGGLETVDEQLAVFDGLPQDEQVHLLKTTVDLIEKMKKEHRDPTDELLDGYVKGDEAKLHQIMTEQYDPKDKLAVKLMKRLLSDRNVRMADRIEAKLKADPEKTQLFAIGAGHVVGDDGVVARLGKQGYTLRRVER